MDYCNVKCSWITNGNKDIKNAIVCNDCIDLSSSNVGDEIVSLDTCIQLLKFPKDFNDCVIQVSCKPDADFAFSHLVVLSEARNMEVYGLQEEYILTVKGELIEKVDDMAVYLKKMKFEKLCSTFSLKFVSLNQKNSLWLYGMAIRVDKKNQTGELLHSSVDLTKVKSMLENSSRPLTPSAEKFLHMVEQQQETLTDLFQLLQRLSHTENSSMNGVNSLSSNYINGQTEVEKNSSRSNLLKTIVGGQMSSFPKFKDSHLTDLFSLLQMSTEPKTNCVAKNIESDEDQNSVVDLLTRQLNQMEERLLKRVSEVEQRLQFKLDYLINLMDNKAKS